MDPGIQQAWRVPSLIRSRQLSAEEYVASLAEKIDRKERGLHAFITLENHGALERARLVDKKARAGQKLGRLAGLVVAIKDNICVNGMKTTCGSKILENFVPPYDATVVERLKAEDAIILGKTNMDEFAMGSTTENSHFGPTKNPWKNSHVPGGSSGGSAVAVSTGMASVALGADTGGSIRCPASFCSVVGLKPTYGLVSRYGLISYGNSLEQIGPISKTVRDSALILSVIAGHDRRDSTSVDGEQVKYDGAVQKEGVEGLKLAVPKEFVGEGTDEQVKKIFWKAVSKLERLGVEHEETSIPSLDYALAAYYIIAMAEASSNLARYDGVRYGFSADKSQADWNAAYSRTRSEGFGAEVKRRILLGTFVLSAGYFEAYYLKAQRLRSLLRQEFESILKRFDLIAGPTMPVLPPRLGQGLSPIEMYRIDINTVPANLTGLPALSVPCGFSDGLPIGLQLIAPRFGEEVLLRAGFAFEANEGEGDSRPSAPSD